MTSELSLSVHVWHSVFFSVECPFMDWKEWEGPQNALYFENNLSCMPFKVLKTLSK